MAVVLPTRAGKLTRWHVFLWEPGKENLADTSGYTAHLTLTAARPPFRTLLTAEEYLPPEPLIPGPNLYPGSDLIPSPAVSTDMALVRIESGHWMIVLDRSVTRSLPASITFDLELVNNFDPEDAVPVCSGNIRNGPATPVRSVR